MSKQLAFGVNTIVEKMSGIIFRSDPIYDSVILTRKEVEDLVNDVWDACMNLQRAPYADKMSGKVPNQQQYINSIIK